MSAESKINDLIYQEGLTQVLFSMEDVLRQWADQNSEYDKPGKVKDLQKVAHHINKAALTSQSANLG